MATDPRQALKDAIEEAVEYAVEEYGHPQAVSTIDDAVDEILIAVDTYIKAIALEYPRVQEWHRGEWTVYHPSSKRSPKVTAAQIAESHEIVRQADKRALSGKKPMSDDISTVRRIIRRKAEEGNGPDWKDYQ